MKQTLFTLFLCLTATLCTQAHPIGIFTLVTREDALTEGDELLIVNIEHRVALGAQRTATRNRMQAPVKIIDHRTVEPLGDVSLLTLGGHPGSWTLHDGEATLKATEQNRNILETKTTRTSQEHLSIHIRENNCAYLVFNIRKKFAHRQIWYNTGDSLFSAFEERPSNIKLFKRTRTAIALTVGNAGYATLYHRDHAFELPIGIEAFTCRWINNQLQRGIIYTAGQVIPKATAVLLHASPGTYTLDATDAQGTPDAQNILKGTDATEPLPSQPSLVYYKFSPADTQEPSSAGFYRANANGDAFTNQANKAYLALPRTARPRTRFLMASLPTAIVSVQQPSIPPKGIYTLDGRKCTTPPPHRICIINGKKVYIK